MKLKFIVFSILLPTDLIYKLAVTLEFKYARDDFTASVEVVIYRASQNVEVQFSE